ncbi:MAG: valine--tRNA ligase, partial [Deltaproteobacteria bacterium]
MADESIPTHYDSAAAAATYYPAWEQRGYNRGDVAASGPAYSVIMPPPNVTGALHMGHALNNTLQDVLVRFKRMDGHNVVWIPGLDHASIAVHWLVERQLHAEGTSRQALGRTAFLARAQAFKEKSEARIVSQQKRLGISCDWARLAFTLDAPRSVAVNEAFVRLYEDGLIYRAERLVNWDPITQTTLSDLEVVHDENVAGELVSLAYPLSDGSGEVVVATTRPETLLGDTAVAVHPDDPRYKHLIGQTVRHPLVDRH